MSAKHTSDKASAQFSPAIHIDIPNIEVEKNYVQYTGICTIIKSM